jgi:ketosteroid isomerase-like protein
MRPPIALAILTSLLFPPRASAETDWESLVKAEQAFAAASASQGMQQAFLAFLADDGILFRPNPVPGRQWIEGHASPGRLTWEPVFADVAQSGDLGYTTGPWELRKNSPEDKPSAQGHYVSLWKKQPDGTWKVVADLGISHQPLSSVPKAVNSPKEGSTKSGKVNRKVDLQAERSDLLDMDRELSSSALEKGPAQAYLKLLAEEARLFRHRTFPVIGKREVFAALSERPGKLSFRPVKADVSSGADLGYTYGTSNFVPSGASEAAALSSSYVRIWKKIAGRWTIVLDIEDPLSGTQR